MVCLIKSQRGLFLVQSFSFDKRWGGGWGGGGGGGKKEYFSFGGGPIYIPIPT